MGVWGTKLGGPCQRPTMADDVATLSTARIDEILLKDPNNPVKLVRRDDGKGYRFQHPYQSMGDVWEVAAKVRGRRLTRPMRKTSTWRVSAGM